MVGIGVRARTYNSQAQGDANCYSNMDDLLCKLKWHAKLLHRVEEWEDKTTWNMLCDFESKIDELLELRGIELAKMIPAKPITDLLMGVYVEARLCHSVGKCPVWDLV